MIEATGRSSDLRSGDGPGLRGSVDEDGTASGTDAAEGVPVDRSGVAAASGLTGTIMRWVEIGLADADVFPINVKLFCDDHG